MKQRNTQSIHSMGLISTTEKSNNRVGNKIRDFFFISRERRDPLAQRTDILFILLGFAVDNATLNRFFTFHFLLPFIIAAIVIIHLLFLHQTGSNKPMGFNGNIDKIPFHPYKTVTTFKGERRKQVLQRPPGIHSRGQQYTVG